MDFQPDYRHLQAAARNERPARLPVYEHIINPGFMAKATGEPMGRLRGSDDPADRRYYFEQYCAFWRDHTYDAVSFEVATNSILPDAGALSAETVGPIQTRADLDAYPWDDLPRRYWAKATPQLEALAEAMPPGMKAVGGVGNGPFEVSEDLVGFEQLCFMQVDDPELFADLYRRIGDLLVSLWVDMVERWSDLFAVFRIGDDMGFKTSPLLAPDTLITHVVPQYRRLAEVIHRSGRPFLLHSCGCIFPIMDELIAAGIDAKHSNEDVIAPFDEWVSRYGGRIGLFGGVDVDLICQSDPDEVYREVLERARRWVADANGYALGSGNSIPDYVPVEGYEAMIRAARDLRAELGQG
jgi:uroporphyrinogen decarboxylase